jgi:hypothetical protein
MIETSGSQIAPGQGLFSAATTPYGDNREKRYCLSQHVTVSELDTCHSTKRYQLLNGERRFQINDATLKVLEYLRAPRTLTELHNFIAKSQSRMAEPAEFKVVV